MKKLIVTNLMMLIGAILLFPLNSAFAGTEKGNSEDTRITQERFQQAETYFGTQVEPKFQAPVSYRIYNSDFNLVYETSDKQDIKLQQLLVKSDLITEINNTHIYQLSR